jgi:hypothetical protein
MLYTPHNFLALTLLPINKTLLKNTYNFSIFLNILLSGTF